MNGNGLVTELASSTYPRERVGRSTGYDPGYAWPALFNTALIWSASQSPSSLVPGFSALLTGGPVQPKHAVSWLAVVGILVVLWLIWRMAE